MDLEHSFTVPVGVDTAWAEFQDIASIAECFPGATVTGVEGETFNGSVKVKLGPIALVYNGSGTFTEKDEAAHRFVVDAKGKDKRGNGTAGATVTVTMADSSGSTDVTVHTDLAITGKPAQFGRGVMQDVSDKLLGQFVACLQQRLDGAGAAAAAPASAPVDPAPPVDPVPQADAVAPVDPVPPVDSVAPAMAADPDLPAAGGVPPTPVAPVAPPPAATPRPASAAGASTGSDDALDLGKTVLPVLARAYWKQAVVALVVIVVVVWLIAR